ncbi:MAG TPA: hypothetical protein VEA19_02540, partial [Actinomycetota bacterium]|nr:hypothetical protein [Actinomycetota bacterium]
GQTDALASIENVFGTDRGDRITGTGYTNKLHGEGGNDLIKAVGASDADTALGGAGSDICTDAEHHECEETQEPDPGGGDDPPIIEIPPAP